VQIADSLRKKDMTGYKSKRRMRMDNNEQKIAKAIEYLRSRGKYVLDKTCAFRPTDCASTNIAQTIANYRRDVMKQPLKAVRR
jgi:hypothetical protein